MTFSNGVTSSNFESIKDDLAAAIADTLGVDNSTVSLTLKSDLCPSFLSMMSLRDLWHLLAASYSSIISHNLRRFPCHGCN